MKVYYDTPTQNVVLNGIGRFFPKGSLIASNPSGDYVAIKYIEQTNNLIYAHWSDIKKQDGSPAGTDLATTLTYLNTEFAKAPTVTSGTVTSVGITGSEFNITNSPITYSGNIGLSLNNSGVTAGTYNGRYTVNAKGIVTGSENVTINSNVVRSLSNATGTTNQFTISATKNARVNYSINVAWATTVLLPSNSTILLEYSLDGGVNWIIANQKSNSINQALVQTGSDDMNLMAEIPANALVRIRPSVSNNSTITYVRGQEVLY